MSTPPGKVLVVDDEEHVCQLVEAALAGQELRCLSVHSGEDAKRQLLGDQYDVVVLDLLLPGVNGMDVLHFISENKLPTRAVCITGGAADEWQAAAMGAGAYEFLRKPFDVSRLTESVVRAAAVRQPEASEIGRDALTGLPTFAAFRQRLAPVRTSCRRQHTPCAAMVIGLDGFARINSAHGYDFGDWVLAQMAVRIRGCLGQEAFLARGSGGEFLVLLAGYSASQAAAVAQLICETISATPLAWKGQSVVVSASIGLAETQEGFPLSESSLLERARGGMKAARAAGGNCVMSHSRAARGPCDPEHQVGWLAPVGALAEKLSDPIRRMLLESARALVRAVEAKDPYTRRHSEHVAFYAEQLARRVGLREDLIQSVRVAALLHDVGKIAVPDSILTKAGRLTEQEFSLIRRHPGVGAAILENISLMKTEADLVRYHHENWDGSGYPTGLAGEAIPLGARIINVADSIDAMLMQRTYKHAYSIEEMVDELARCTGGQFDPKLAPTAIEWCREHRCELILPSVEAQADSA